MHPAALDGQARVNQGQGGQQARAAIAASLRETQQRHPGLLIGSYPNFSRQDYSVKITLESRDAAVVNVAFAELQQRLAAPPVTVVRTS